MTNLKNLRTDIEKTLEYLDIEDNPTDLKKHPDGGFYKLEGRLIHYYDDHKNFETTKININKI